MILQCACFQGEGYDEKLKEILEAEILPIVQEFDGKVNDGTAAHLRSRTQKKKKKEKSAQVNDSLARSEFSSRVGGREGREGGYK